MDRDDMIELKEYADRLFKATNDPGNPNSLIAMTRDEAKELSDLLKRLLDTYVVRI